MEKGHRGWRYMLAMAALGFCYAQGIYKAYADYQGKEMLLEDLAATNWNKFLWGAIVMLFIVFIMRSANGEAFIKGDFFLGILVNFSVNVGAIVLMGHEQYCNLIIGLLPAMHYGFGICMAVVCGAVGAWLHLRSESRNDGDSSRAASE